jgi:hypothetical protein
MAVTTRSYQNCGTNGGWFGKFLGLILFAVLGCILYTVCEHAIEKHGTDAFLVDQCLNNHGAMGVWQRKSDGHFAFPCQIDSNKWGIKFDKCSGENCTAFIKEKLKRLEHLIRYLHNQNFEPYDQAAKLLEESIIK